MQKRPPVSHTECVAFHISADGLDLILAITSRPVAKTRGGQGYLTITGDRRVPITFPTDQRGKTVVGGQAARSSAQVSDAKPSTTTHPHTEEVVVKLSVGCTQ